MKFKRMAVSSGNGDGGPFLKIEDNSSVTGVLRGEVFEFYQSWPEGGSKQIFDKPTAGAMPRFKVNFIVFEEGRFIAKIWDFPPTISNMLADIGDSYDLSTIKIKITKNRSGKRVSYMVLPLAGDKDKLSAKHLKEINAVELNILGHQEPAPQPAVKNFAPGADDESDVPF